MFVKSFGATHGLAFLSLLFLSCIIPLYSDTIIDDLVSMSSGEVTKVSAVQPKHKCASAAAVKVMDLCLAITIARPVSACVPY